MSRSTRHSGGRTPSRRPPSPAPGAKALLYIATSVGITAGILLIGRQISGTVAGHVSVSTVDQRCGDSVNRWANRQLDSYHQELLAQHHGNQSQLGSNAATGALNWIDHLLTDRMLKTKRQELTTTTLRTNQCRPLFQ